MDGIARPKVMKILHVLATPRAEGTPNLVLDWLATGLHEQHVYVLHSQPADLTERLSASGASYEEAEYFALGWRKFFAILFGIRRICQKRRPDVVICWTTGFANWVCLGAKLAGVGKLLVHSGNPPNRGFKEEWMARYVMWPISWVGAQCICCSDYVRDQFRAIPAMPARLFRSVYNCSRAEDVARRAALVEPRQGNIGEKMAVMVATLELHKDHKTLFLSLPTILVKEPGFRIRLIGDGTLRQELEELANHLDISHAIEFLGTRRDVPELLGGADLFVFSTTEQEGLGSVLLEALAAGLPVVATDVPACREILAGGKYGTLVKPADPNALSDAILTGLRKPVRNSEAVRYAKEFTPENMIAQYLH